MRKGDNDGGKEKRREVRKKGERRKGRELGRTNKWIERGTKEERKGSNESK